MVHRRLQRSTTSISTSCFDFLALASQSSLHTRHKRCHIQITALYAGTTHTPPLINHRTSRLPSQPPWKKRLIQHFATMTFSTYQKYQQQPTTTSAHTDSPPHAPREIFPPPAAPAVPNAIISQCSVKKKCTINGSPLFPARSILSIIS